MLGKVLVVDQEKCTGCRQCELVCSVFHYGVSNPGRSRVRVIKWEDKGFYLPMTCQHCEKPVCTEVCPTKACQLDLENQRIIIDKDRCIGCRTCIVFCPFGAPFFDIKERVAAICDYCDGAPQCADFCDTKAIDYVDVDKVNMAKKRKLSLKYFQSLSQAKNDNH